MNQEENQQKKEVTVVATAVLSEDQVKQALVNLVSQEKNLIEVLQNKASHMWIKWHVNKWDDPAAFCTLTFGVEKEENE